MKKIKIPTFCLSLISSLMLSCSDGEIAAVGIGVWAYFALFRDAGYSGLRKIKDPTRRPGYVVVEDRATGDRMAFHTATLREMYSMHGSQTAREIRRIMSRNGGEWATWSGRTVAEFVYTLDPYVPLYEGVYTGYIYENQEESKDVNYLQAQEENRRNVVQLVSLSERFGLSLEAAGSLLEMKSAFRKIIGEQKKQERLSPEDAQALLANLQKTTGLSQEELLEGVTNPKTKSKILSKAAHHLNTSEESVDNFVSLMEELIE